MLFNNFGCCLPLFFWRQSKKFVEANGQTTVYLLYIYTNFEVTFVPRTDFRSGQESVAQVQVSKYARLECSLFTSILRTSMSVLICRHRASEARASRPKPLGSEYNYSAFFALANLNPDLPTSDPTEKVGSELFRRSVRNIWDPIKSVRCRLGATGARRL